MLYISLGHQGRTQEGKSKYSIIFIEFCSTWMNLDEFSALSMEIVDKEFPVREIPFCFNASMKLQISEIDGDRHYNMTFQEFLEAFCRMVDKYSPIPIGEKPVSRIILICLLII